MKKKKKKKGVWLKKLKGCWKRFMHKVCCVYGYDRKVYIILATILIVCVILLMVL